MQLPRIPFTCVFSSFSLFFPALNESCIKVKIVDVCWPGIWTALSLSLCLFSFRLWLTFQCQNSCRFMVNGMANGFFRLDIYKCIKKAVAKGHIQYIFVCSTSPFSGLECGKRINQLFNVIPTSKNQKGSISYSVLSDGKIP